MANPEQDIIRCTELIKQHRHKDTAVSEEIAATFFLSFLSIHFPSKKFKFAFYVKEKSASVDKGTSFNQVANHFQKLILYIHSLGQNP